MVASSSEALALLSTPPTTDFAVNTSEQISTTRDKSRGSFRRWSWTSFLFGLVGGVALAASSRSLIDSDAVPIQSSPLQTSLSPASSTTGDSQTETLTMSQVLVIAEDALDAMRRSVNDYTATLVKQESIDGTLSEATKMELKVMCVHRGGDQTDSQPMRVYLRFVAPDSVAGREVIWAQDLNQGQLLVHEGGFLGLVTLYLDPLGPIAMQGQRYPISEIGLTKLLQKLIERGEQDRDSPDVSVTLTKGIKLDGLDVQLISVTRRQPTTGENNFSRAEIVFDAERQIPLRYTAFGWPTDNGPAPLLESYTYTDVKLNVGLADVDFDPQNPAYNYP